MVVVAVEAVEDDAPARVPASVRPDKDVDDPARCILLYGTLSFRLLFSFTHSLSLSVLPKAVVHGIPYYTVVSSR